MRASVTTPGIITTTRTIILRTGTGPIIHRVREAGRLTMPTG